ncbi:zinc metalloprotease [Longispora fulva]|uniref:Zn-dependent metalloprotease n=1 Tax=Longispora fulva TaxID=619741 RepID=A0A8J7KFX9_9ACTN|nr:M4 family metallopeptidase [Longispora fulva]MBG6134299.1 Zn-dependent metalloprotease [Longispora fulva]GIG63013.1 zinc metalloprotease [Longispora fulva]
MQRRHLLAAGAAVAVAVAGSVTMALTASGSPGTAAAQPATSSVSYGVPDQAAAVATSDQVVTGQPAVVHASAADSFAQRAAVSTPQGLQYVTYDRRYKGLPVVGGDVTVVTDAAGKLRSTSVAQNATIDVSTTPTVTAEQAKATSLAQLTGGARTVDRQRLVVLAWDSPVLAWETVVDGVVANGPARLHVFVDAGTGRMVRSYNEIVAGEGTSKYNGPNPLQIDTTHSGGSYTTVDPNRPGLKCTDYDTKQPFSRSEDKFGNGSGTDRETGCVDALFAAQHEWDMLKNWLGRSGIDGQGHGFEVRVGLGDVNAYWVPQDSHIEIGHNKAGNWITSMDVVGHEFGHGLDQYTGGGAAGDGEHGLGEGTGDIFGALTEAYANEPSQYDSPDYLVGEMIDLEGKGPIRNMAEPEKSNYSSYNCYSSAIPNAEVHAAAGPMNHWFYLLAEGTNPGNGKPTSPTCNNGGTLTGIGIKDAGLVFYHAMLAKPSNMTYKKYRTLTLQSAKDLDNTCGYFAKVKAAWDAVSVPAQSGDPTCSGSTPTASPSASPRPSGTPSTSPSPSASPSSSPTGQPGTVTVTNPGDQAAFTGWSIWPVQVKATSSNGGTLTFSATGLPPGLSISSTGNITGTPTTGGTYTVKVTATSSGGGTGSTTFSWQIYQF